MFCAVHWSLFIRLFSSQFSLCILLINQNSVPKDKNFMYRMQKDPKGFRYFPYIRTNMHAWKSRHMGIVVSERLCVFT